MKTTIEADVHAKGIVSNLFGAFLDKLGKALLGDFKSVFNNSYDDGYAFNDVKFKSGQTPFKKEKVDGKDPVLYPDYEAQATENGTWNPDDDGYVDSSDTNQIVVSDEGIQMTPESEDVPNLTITISPIMSKGYEGFVIAFASYTVDGKTYEKQELFEEKDRKDWLEELKQEWNIPDNANVTEETVEQEAEAATKLTVTLQKVTGSTSYDIALTRITANYNLSQVVSDLDAILSDDDFVESVPETETTYLIVSDDDDNLDVTEIADDTESSVSDIYQQLFNETVDMIDCLKIAKWGAKGAIRSDFMSTVESMRWSFESILDKLGEWYIVSTSKVPQISHSDVCFDIDNLTAIELAKAVQEKVTQYLDALDLIYVDFTDEQQNQLNTFKESIKSMCDYSLGQLILQ